MSLKDRGEASEPRSSSSEPRASGNSSLKLYVGLAPSRPPKAVRHSREWIAAERAWNRYGKGKNNIERLLISTAVLRYTTHHQGALK